MALQRCDLPIPLVVSIYSNTVSGLLRHHMLSVWGKLVLCLSNTYYQQMQTFSYSSTFDNNNNTNNNNNNNLKSHTYINNQHKLCSAFYCDLENIMHIELWKCDLLYVTTDENRFLSQSKTLLILSEKGTHRQ